MLVATKSDKIAEKKIDAEKGLRLAQEHQMSFFETSALSGTNVNESFLQIVKNIKDKQMLQKKTNVVSLKNKESGDGSS
jgi:Ras-related protein Rab-11A